jgi:hypothetical protein
MPVAFPTAVQFPAEAHDTGPRETSGCIRAFAGHDASTPAAQMPDVSVNSSPCEWPELSVYSPTALQFPAEAHDTDSTPASGLVLAFAGSDASTPTAQFVDANASGGNAANINSTAQASGAKHAARTNRRWFSLRTADPDARDRPCIVLTTMSSGRTPVRGESTL